MTLPSFAGPRLGFFTRLLERASAADRYRFALEQIEHAERFGFASAWVAQHHFGEHEGGLPSPFVLLAAAAERTERIALGTAVVTLPLEDPVRAAEDATVLDAVSGGRAQLGVAAGGTPASFAAFGRDATLRRELFDAHLDVFRDTLAGAPIRGTDSRAYPASGDLAERIWQATFSAAGGARAGAAADGLLLSRTQPRDASAPDAPLYEVQLPIIEAYRDALPACTPARVLSSRTALVVDEEHRTRALELASTGLRALASAQVGPDAEALTVDELVRVTDTHIGTVEEVVASLGADLTLAASTDVTFQVHSIPASHDLTLRSIELLATGVAPRLGIGVGENAVAGLRHAHSDPHEPAAPRALHTAKGRS